MGWAKRRSSLKRELSIPQLFLGVSESQIGNDISTATFDLFSLHCPGFPRRPDPIQCSDLWGFAHGSLMLYLAYRGQII